MGKRVGKAVRRNQVKRRLREAARLTPVAAGWDIVLVARAPAATASYADLQGALSQLLRRARIAGEPPGQGQIP